MARIMKLHRYNDWQMTPIDFQVTRSKVKVTVTKNIFTQWPSLIRRAHMGGMHVLQTALVLLVSIHILSMGNLLLAKQEKQASDFHLKLSK